ncbi:MAG: hypothetical protein HY077_01875 [Elusimicrobia bacterium]|nr:hypothetical protein [Elusimicrobiota bacterium]
MRPTRDAALLGLISAGIFLFVFVMTHRLLGDDISRFEALTSFMEGRGFRSATYSMIGPLMGAPLYLLGRVWETPEWWWTRFGCLFFACVFGSLAWRVRLPGSAALMRRFVALLLSASMIPHALIGNSAELLTTICVASGLLALALGRPGLGWAAILVAGANSPATAVGVGLVAVAYSCRVGRLRYLAMPVVMAAAVMLENWVRRGGPFVTGYDGPVGSRGPFPYSGGSVFGYPLPFGLISILFSFGKGLLFFAPGLLLARAAWRKAPGPQARDFLAYSLLFLGGLVLVFSNSLGGSGGWTWGPRPFLFAAVPASFCLALCLDGGSSAKAALALLVLLSMSCWVALSGVIYSYQGLEICTANDFTLEPLCWYVPEFSVLWRPLVTWTLFAPGHWLWIAYFGAGWLAFCAPLLAPLQAGLMSLWRESRDAALRCGARARW